MTRFVPGRTLSLLEKGTVCGLTRNRGRARQARRKRPTPAHPWLFCRQLDDGAGPSGVGPIAYARIDCDIYEPTLECLRYLTPRLSHGAVLVFDDWPHSLDIGEGRAFYEWALTVPNLRFEFLSFCTWGHFYIRV